MSQTLRCALDAKRYQDMRDIERHRTLSGHTHPQHIACDHTCFVATSRGRLLVDRQFMRACGFPQRSPF